MLVTALSTIQAQFLSAELPCKMIHFGLRNVEKGISESNFKTFLREHGPATP